MLKFSYKQIVALIFPLLTPQSALGITADFVIGEDLYYNCAYQQYSPTILKIDRRDCSDEDAKSICTGNIKCDVYNQRTKNTRWSVDAAACDANPDESCPTAGECGKSNSSLIVGAIGKPRIKPRSKALADFENWKEHRPVQATVHKR